MLKYSTDVPTRASHIIQYTSQIECLYKTSDDDVIATRRLGHAVNTSDCVIVVVR